MKTATDKVFYKYIEEVESGKRNAGELEKLAVDRFLADIKANKFEFDFDHGYRFVKFARLCYHWKGEKAGTPIIFEGHQEFYRVQQFGWRRGDGTRRFKSCYKEIARKNAKTTEEALVGLFLMSKDGEAGAQVFAGATKEEQARIVVNDAAQIAKISPALHGRFELQKAMEGYKQVIYPTSSSFFRALGRDSKTDDGKDAHGGIIDEYHSHPTDKVLNIIESGQGARIQPLMDVITTAGVNKNGPCYRLREVCINILRGVMTDESQLSMIFTLTDPEKWEDQADWIQSNPNWGVSVQPGYLETRYTKAKNEGGSKLADYKTKNLNLWVDSADVWLSDEDWIGGNHRAIPMQRRPAFGGLDMGKTRDMTAFSLLFPRDDGKIDLKTWYWIPEDTVAEDNINGDQYRRWASLGHLNITRGNAIDIKGIAKTILGLLEGIDIRVLGYDPYLEGHGLIADLYEAINDRLVKVPQTFIKLTTPTEELERLVLNKELNHEGNPVTRWQMGNVVIMRDTNNNIKIDKKESNNKIDGIAATINAIRVMQTIEKAPAVLAVSI